MTRRGRCGDRRANGISRRRFVQGLAAGGLIASFDLRGVPAFALKSRSEQPELAGDRFDLEIAEVEVDFTGRPGVATAVNGSVPAPLLRWREGDTVTLAVTNRLRDATSIHYADVDHGRRRARRAGRRAREERRGA